MNQETAFIIHFERLNIRKQNYQSLARYSNNLPIYFHTLAEAAKWLVCKEKATITEIHDKPATAAFITVY